MNRRETPEINAGSMADIAFLLLIFFLVTTTMDVDLGIPKMLSKDLNHEKIDVLENNVLEINLNGNNEIMINEKLVTMPNEIKQLAMDFIDNGGGTNLKGETCDWCTGRKYPNLSDHPDKALIAIKSSRNTNYATYIAVQNEVLSAYAELRNTLSTSMYGMSYDDMVNQETTSNSKALQEKILFIKSKYPQHLVEEDPIK